MKKKKNKTRLLLRDGFFSTVLSMLTCYLLSLLFFNISFFNPLSKALKDFSFLDVYYAERLDTKKTVDTKIVLINAEHKTRPELALILQKILDSNPKAVGFDIILKEFEKTPTDTLLASLLNENEVVTTYIIQPDSLKITNHPFFQGNGVSGFVNLNFDSKNSVVREFNGTYIENGMLENSFAVELAKKYVSANRWKELNMEPKLTRPSVINYQGAYNNFLHFSPNELMGHVDGSVLNNKIVLLGYFGSPTGNPYDIEDKHFTPLNSNTAGKSVPDMFGVVIHANILSMLLANDFMYRVPQFWTFVLMFLLSFLASIYFIWLGTRLKISYRTIRKAIVFVFSILLVWLTLVLFKNGIVLKSAPIIAVTVFSAGFVKYYKHLALYAYKKVNFKSYFKN